MPGLFDGEHELRLEATPDGGTRFAQREVFTGLLVRWRAESSTTPSSDSPT